MNFRET